EASAAIRSETLALDALIQKIITQAEASAGQGPADTMVFLGNRHQSFPAVVVTDPVLEPVDKLVWMVIMLAVGETGGNTTFPGYESIGKLANVSSRSTIARAIAILRASRWLTLCARVRKANGRFRGNVYAVHDEPPPLADALHLDPDYMAFLGHALGHGHARVRAVAQGVLDSLDEEIQAGQDICAQPHPIERRIQSVVATEGKEPGRLFSFTLNVVRRLRSDCANSQKGVNHHDQNSNTADDRVRNSNSGSSYIYKTTTTPAVRVSNFALAGKDNQPLVYPVRLCDNHREIAARYLSALAPEQRQPVLDELAGRFLAEQKGMKPVYDEVSFLHSLCKQMAQGKFLPNLGIKVRDGRQERKKQEQKAFPPESSQRSRETEGQRRKRKAAGKAQIAEMRKILGMRPSTVNQNVTGES
ncbi:MAG: STY4528 family pathogenicity island replication protein, partial [Pseudomonadota bacterium]